MKPLNTVHDLRLRLWLRSLIGIGAAGLLLFAGMAFVTIGEVRSGSAAFAQNRIAFDVAKDFLNPPQSLLRAETFFHRVRIARGPDDIAQAEDTLLKSRAELEAGHQHYLAVMPPGHLRDLVTVEAYDSAEQWYNIAEQEYLPAVKRNGWQKAEPIRIEKMDALVRRNLATSEEIAGLANDWIISNGDYVNRTVRARRWELAGVGLITLFFQLLMGMMIHVRVGMGTARLQATLDELRRKNTEVEAFVYIVSHDLRAPLVNLQGFVRELDESCARLKALAASEEMHNKEIAEVLDGEVAGALRFISASSAKFDRLIKALLNLSRQGRQTYKWTLVDVQELVAGTVASLQQLLDESGASLRVGLLPPAFADENSLSQIFSNLITNAVKYREPERPLEIEVGGETECEFVRYWVRDNGLGLPGASKDRVFQAFQRFHPQRAEGDGMGLALVHRIAERHGGKAWVESQEGVGSAFYFSVPASPVAAPV
jgi:signal transduction histidine kinase